MIYVDRLTPDQKDALVQISKPYPGWHHGPNLWTAASSLIRKGLVKKRPATAYTLGMVRPVNGAEYTFTPKGFSALKIVDPVLCAKIDEIIDKML